MTGFPRLHVHYKLQAVILKNLYSRACQCPKMCQKFPISSEFWIYFKVLKSY